MALYKDGNPVSGLNSIPRLTLAQYNALNVKPEFWVRTDAPESYKKLSADQVSYDSNTSVKDKIDNEHITSIRLTDSDFTYDSTYKYWQSNDTLSNILQGKTLVGTLCYPNYAAMLMSAYNNSSGKISVATFNATTGQVGTSAEGFVLDLMVRIN